VSTNTKWFGKVRVCKLSILNGIINPTQSLKVKFQALRLAFLSLRDLYGKLNKVLLMAPRQNAEDEKYPFFLYIYLFIDNFLDLMWLISCNEITTSSDNYYSRVACFYARHWSNQVMLNLQNSKQYVWFWKHSCIAVVDSLIHYCSNWQLAWWFVKLVWNSN